MNTISLSSMVFQPMLPNPESEDQLLMVELMNVGANYLREHIIDKARILVYHNKCRWRPNIVPSEAESWYYVRT